MSSGFAVYYIEANVVCALVFGILLIHNHFNIDRQEKQIKYGHALAAFMLYFIADCFWAALGARMIPRTLLAVVLDDLALYLLMSLITYTWLQYVMAYEQAPHRNRTINRIAVAFPFAVATLMMIGTYIIAPRVLITEALEETAVYSAYLVTVPYIYIVAILFYTLSRAKSEENPVEKRKHIYIGLLPLMTIAGGLVEMILFPDLPIFCFCAMLLMLMFYIQSIELLISLDPLTQLNNRGQLSRYIAQRSNLAIEDRLTVVMMMDIDDFKAINDTRGHAEGDRALVIVSDALKRAVNGHSMPSFLCRYGGDEFIAIIHPVAMEESERLIQDIRDEIEQAAADLPYPLSVSIGCEELKGGAETIQACIARADENLYRDKGRRKARLIRQASA